MAVERARALEQMSGELARRAVKQASSMALAIAASDSYPAPVFLTRKLD